MLIARVNNYEIEEKEYLAELNKLLKESDSEHPDAELKQKALDNLINAIVVLQKARTLNIQVSDDEVQQEMINLQIRFESPEEFEKMLTCSDCSQEEIMQRIFDKLIVKRYLEDYVSELFEIEEEKLQEFYEKNTELFKHEEMVRVSHILIAPEKGLSAAQELRDKINSPEDFYSIAEMCSQCPSCCKSGDLGYIVKGKMVSEFEEAAFRLSENEISQPIESEHGYHIIMVTDRKEAGTLVFEEVMEPLKKRLSRIEQELKIDRHISELKEKADIFINKEYFN